VESPGEYGPLSLSGKRCRFSFGTTPVRESPDEPRQERPRPRYGQGEGPSLPVLTPHGPGREQAGVRLGSEEISTVHCLAIDGSSSARPARGCVQKEHWRNPGTLAAMGYRGPSFVAAWRVHLAGRCGGHGTAGRLPGGWSGRSIPLGDGLDVVNLDGGPLAAGIAERAPGSRAGSAERAPACPWCSGPGSPAGGAARQCDLARRQRQLCPVGRAAGS
jgi:hypothetical protein